ncbi:effector-associated domain EAD1-containing protein [Micromonospora yasonensis]|uniref:effector-associated domain EAD1-containing protein n=1 Tax=Micromonospora yasonensis TaxID=1128667 RepID=UPI00222F8AEC|nr:effector-associated domain EAD1-containing protein [Micromonospora yasonensis]MCW3842865.1 effector-associated domain EAD1-containing protein [Micromonospora yasonensis]
MTAPSLPGRSFEELAEALLDVFPERSPFEQMLRYDLEIRLARLVGDASGMEHIVFRVISVAEEHGWLAALVDAALRRRPGTNSLYRWAERHPHLVDLRAEQRTRESRLQAESVGRQIHASEDRRGVPPGRRHSAHDLVEGNLALDLVRALLLLNEPGNERVLAARSLGALAAAGSTTITESSVRRQLWEIADLLLEYVEPEVMRPPALILALSPSTVAAEQSTSPRTREPAKDESGTARSALAAPGGVPRGAADAGDNDSSLLPPLNEFAPSLRQIDKCLDM